MKRIGFFLFFCILSLYGLAQAENDKDTLIIRQDKINEFINEMNEVDKSMDFINEPPTLTPPVLSDTLRMPKFDLTPREEMPKISPYTFSGNPFVDANVNDIFDTANKIRNNILSFNFIL